MLWPVEKECDTEPFASAWLTVLREHGRRVKGARHAHAAMRAQGRTPGDEGRTAIALNRKTRKFVKEMEQKYGPGWRCGRGHMGGI
jgi:hypothetical protein